MKSSKPPGFSVQFPFSISLWNFTHCCKAQKTFPLHFSKKLFYYHIQAFQCLKKFEFSRSNLLLLRYYSYWIAFQGPKSLNFRALIFFYCTITAIGLLFKAQKVEFSRSYLLVLHYCSLWIAFQSQKSLNFRALIFLYCIFAAFGLLFKAKKV